MNVDKLSPNRALAIALGYPKENGELLEELFNSRKGIYEGMAKSKDQVWNNIVLGFTVETAVRIHRAYGLVNAAFFEDDHENLLKLIKNSYKYVWNHVSKNAFPDVEELFEGIKKTRGCFPTTIEISNIVIVLNYLCRYLNKPLFDSELFAGLNRDLERTMIGVGLHHKFSSKTMHRDLESELKNFISKYRLPTKEISMEDLYESIVTNRISAEALQLGLRRQSAILKVLGIFEIDLAASYRFKRDELQDIYMNSFTMSKSLDLTEDENLDLIASLMYTKAILSDYQKSKRIVLSKDISGDSTDDSDNNPEITRLTSMLSKKDAQISELSLKISARESELVAEIDRLKRQLQLKEDIETELRAQIKAFEEVFDKAPEEVDKDFEIALKLNKDLKTILEELNDKLLVVVGGNPNWVKKMRNILPNIIYLDGNRVNYSLTFLNNVDFVFINTMSGSHTATRRVEDYLEGRGVPIGYLNTPTNLELSVREMAAVIGAREESMKR